MNFPNIYFSNSAQISINALLRHTSSKSVKAFTLVELLVVVAIIGMLIGILTPAVNMVREAGRKAQCLNNQKQLTLAFLNYSTAHNGVLPASYYLNPVQQGWTIDLLPHLDAETFMNDWDVESNYFDGNNKNLLMRYFGIFHCPSTPDARRMAVVKKDFKGNSIDVKGCVSDYYVHSGGVHVRAYGKDAVWRNPLGTNERLSSEPEDGISQTILINEQCGRPILRKKGEKTDSTQVAKPHFSLWAAAPVTQIPADLRLRSEVINVTNEAFFSFHSAGTYAGFMDGSARLVSNRALPYVVLALNTRDGGENIRAEDLEITKFDESYVKDGLYPDGKPAN
ncbi:MAG: DUF1559 domain-containing protein [Thermoguttaceae bacterium]|nr:DUF1559 domain-containing protein [Thermoguttaceae bacterium]